MLGQWSSDTRVRVELATTCASSREFARATATKDQIELPVCDLLRAFIGYNSGVSTPSCPTVHVGRRRDPGFPYSRADVNVCLPQASELLAPALTYRAIMADLRTSQRTPLRCTECARRRVRCNKKVPCAECILRHQSHKCSREVVRVRGRPTV